MARLDGRDSHGPKWLLILPAPPEASTGDFSEYVLQVWPGASQAPVTRHFSIEGWQGGHESVLLLARAFARSELVLGATLPVDLWGIGREEPAALHRHLDWLDVTLWGNVRQGRVAIQFFIQDHHSNLFTPFFIQTTVDRAAGFGSDLESEILKAAPVWAAENWSCQQSRAEVLPHEGN